MKTPLTLLSPLMVPLDAFGPVIAVTNAALALSVLVLSVGHESV